jgi:hypothetical protein
MDKISTVVSNRVEDFKADKLTVGLDLGDRFSHYCILNGAGDVIREQRMPTTPNVDCHDAGWSNRSCHGTGRDCAASGGVLARWENNGLRMVL